jgi:predicted DNA-binding transcriptional regulator AlpA
MPPKTRITPTAAEIAASLDVSTMHADDMFSTESLSRITSVHVQSYEKMRREGKGPKYLRISERIVRYRRRDVEAWLKECEQEYLTAREA